MVTYTEPTRDGPESFTFISDRLFVLPTPGQRDSTTDSRGSSQLDVFTFSEPIGDSPAQPARRVASFMLPLLRNRETIHRISCRCDPAPPPSTRAETRHLGHPRVFQLAPDNRVLCLNIHAFDPDDDELNMLQEGMLYIPFHALLDPVNAILDGPNSDSTPIDIAWEEWAEKTSWMDTIRTFMGNECYVYGQRVVMISASLAELLGGEEEEEEVRLETRHSLLVLDFEPVRVKRLPEQPMASFVKTSPEKLSDMIGLSSQTDLLRAPFLEGEHKANRELIVRKSNMNGDLSETYSVMVDDEHVMLILHNRRGQESSLLVYSFN